MQINYLKFKVVSHGHLREFVAFIDQIAAVGFVTVKRPEDVPPKNNMRPNGNIEFPAAISTSAPERTCGRRTGMLSEVKQTVTVRWL